MITDARFAQGFMAVFGIWTILWSNIMLVKALGTALVILGTIAILGGGKDDIK